MRGGFLAGVYDKGAPVVVLAISPLHVGSGRGAISYVDLPVQRDFMGFPCVWASSLKGALRSFLWLKYGCDKSSSSDVCSCVKLLYGPERGEEDAYAGSMFVSDLHLLALPGPCGAGVCLYTSPFLLQRFREKLRIFAEGDVGALDENGLANELYKLVSGVIEGVSDLEADRVAVSDVNELVVRGYSVLAFRVYSEDRLVGVPGLVSLFGKVLESVLSNSTLSRLYARRVVVVPDVVARHVLGLRLLVRQTRVALDYRSKRVKPGALWSEEYVPEFTLMHGAFLFSRPRAADAVADACSTFAERKLETGDDVALVFKKLMGVVDKNTFHLVIGGHETIGKGLVRVAMYG